MNDGRRGSVKQADNGTWWFIVDVPSSDLDARGRPKRRQTRRRGFATKKAAQAELTRVLGTLEQQTYVAPARQTVAEFLTETWLPAIEHTVRPSTFESYRRNVRLHIAGRPIGHRQLQQVDGASLNALYGMLLAGDTNHRALSATSVRYVSTILHRAFRDAIKWQAIQRNPVEQSDPPAPNNGSSMTIWTPEQLTKFLEGTEAMRTSAAWWLLATTGMRRGECLGLRWSDIDLDAKRIRISRALIIADVERKDDPGFRFSAPKTRAGTRTISIDEDLVAALRAHRARQHQERLKLGKGYADQDLVVSRADGDPYHPKLLSASFLAQVERLQLPRIRLHDLRHTWATHALEAGVNPKVVQEMLGHSHVSVTLGIYSHVNEQMQADASSRVAELRRKGRSQ